MTARSRELLWIVVSLLAVGFLSVGRSQAAMNCDAVLAVDNQSPAPGASSYEMRSDVRCEGTVREDQAGSVGVAITRLELMPREDLNSTTTVAIGRTAEVPQGATATVTVLERTADYYYRLDVALDDSTTVTWPLDEIAKPLGVTLSDVSLFGRLIDPASPGQTIFFPVVLRQSQSVAPSEKSEIALGMILTTPARDVSVGVGHYEVAGKCIVDQELLSIPSSSPSTPLEVKLPATIPRAFCVEVTFSTKNLGGKFVEDSDDLYFRK